MTAVPAYIAANATDGMMGVHALMFLAATTVWLVATGLWGGKLGDRDPFDETKYEDTLVKMGVFASMFWAIAGFLVGILIARLAASTPATLAPVTAVTAVTAVIAVPATTAIALIVTGIVFGRRIAVFILAVGISVFAIILVRITLGLIGLDDPVIVLGVLVEILCPHPVTGRRRIARQLQVFVVNLGGIAPDFHFRTIALIAAISRIPGLTPSTALTLHIAIPV